MTAADLIHILPLIILGGGAIVTMLTIAAYRSHILTFVLTLGTLVASMSTVRVQSPAVSESIGPLIRFDGYAVFFIIVILLAAIAVVVMAYGYLRGRSVVREEFYVLVLTAMLGCVFLVSSVHFASFFLGLELLSVSLYSLAAYHRVQAVDIEAGIKYLLPAATSSAFLLFGMALVYARSGTMSLWVMAETGRIPAGRDDPVAFVGAGMIFVSLAFKLALIPFHFWAGDVYEGAPAPVTALIATTSKGAVFALLLRYFSGMDVRLREPFLSLFTWIAVFTMLVGTYLALRQSNVKRLLAYSSITHMGYLLVAFLAVREVAATALSFYLLTYFITTLGVFGVITALSGKEKDFTEIGDYRGLIADHPFLGGILTAMMLSLAGVPLTAGFLGKFYLLYAGVRSNLWLLVLVLVAASVISLFYYLRVVVTLYQPVPPESEQSPAAQAHRAAPSVSFIGGVVLAVLLLLLIWIGVYPGPILHLIQEMIA
jgi:NADH-quinone oxidoreductase subunit N